MNTLEWIPWKRYLLRLHDSDANKTIFLGRFRLRKSAEKQVERLCVFKGYSLDIIDTKKAALEGKIK
jgi:hypothetical protein